MILTETAALTGRRLLRLRRSPGEVLAVTLTPVTMVIVMGYLLDKTIVMPGGAGYLDFMMAGVGAQVALAGFGTSAIAVADDLHGGLVERFVCADIESFNPPAGSRSRWRTTCATGSSTGSGPCRSAGSRCCSRSPCATCCSSPWG